MGVERFRQDEGGYADWLAVHPNGFIFNNFGGPHRGFNVLHRAGCSFLGRQRDEGRRTRYQKVCGDEIADLISIMAQLRAGTEGWKECGKCKPLSVADASREPQRHPDSTGATLQSAETVKIVQSAPRRRPSFAPAPAPGDFVLWRPADEVAAVEVEPLLASREAKSHPSQRRVQAYLDEVEATLAVRLKEYGVRFYLRVDVVRQEATNLLRHYDLENYLTPLAQSLRNPAVLAMAEKRYPRTASDRSRITLGRVQAGAPLEGWTPMPPEWPAHHNTPRGKPRCDRV